MAQGQGAETHPPRNAPTGFEIGASKEAAVDCRRRATAKEGRDGAEARLSAEEARRKAILISINPGRVGRESGGD